MVVRNWKYPVGMEEAMKWANLPKGNSHISESEIQMTVIIWEIAKGNITQCNYSKGGHIYILIFIVEIINSSLLRHKHFCLFYTCSTFTISTI